MSQFNLPHGTNSYKVENRNNRKKKTYIGKQSGESAESVLTKKRKGAVEGLAEKKGFKPRMKE